jgi:hypothetical protein
LSSECRHYDCIEITAPRFRCSPKMFLIIENDYCYNKDYEAEGTGYSHLLTAWSRLMLCRDHYHDRNTEDIEMVPDQV